MPRRPLTILMFVCALLLATGIWWQIKPTFELHHFPDESLHGDLLALSQCLECFKNLNGRLPSTGEGLAALVHPPPGAVQVQLLERVSPDWWDRPYQYHLDPSNPKGYDLYSLGPDGIISSDDVRYPR